MATKNSSDKSLENSLSGIADILETLVESNKKARKDSADMQKTLKIIVASFTGKQNVRTETEAAKVKEKEKSENNAAIGKPAASGAKVATDVNQDIEQQKEIAVQVDLLRDIKLEQETSNTSLKKLIDVTTKSFIKLTKAVADLKPDEQYRRKEATDPFRIPAAAGGMGAAGANEVIDVDAKVVGAKGSVPKGGGDSKGAGILLPVAAGAAGAAAVGTKTGRSIIGRALAAGSGALATAGNLATRIGGTKGKLIGGALLGGAAAYGGGKVLDAITPESKEDAAVSLEADRKKKAILAESVGKNVPDEELKKQFALIDVEAREQKKENNKDKPSTGTKLAGALAGGYAGGKLGAGLGSFLGPKGAIAGGVIGSIAGGIVGDEGVERAYAWMAKKKKETKPGFDAQARPDGKDPLSTEVRTQNRLEQVNKAKVEAEKALISEGNLKPSREQINKRTKEIIKAQDAAKPSGSSARPVGSQVASSVRSTPQQGMAASFSESVFMQKDPENYKKFRSDLKTRTEQLTQENIKNGSYPDTAKLLAEKDAKEEMIKKYEKEARAAGALGGTVSQPSVERAPSSPSDSKALTKPTAAAIKPSSVPNTGDASQMTDYLKATALIESSGKRDAKASVGSASGMFQFLESTWEGTTKKMGKNYTMEDRNDPKKAAEVMEYFTKQNKQHLEKQRGVPASNTDMYMAHFLGAEGATKFLGEKDKDANQLGAKLHPAAAKNNPAIFYKDPKTKQQPRTLQEIYDMTDQKMAKAQESVATGKFGGKPLPTDVAGIKATGDTTVARAPKEEGVKAALAAAGIKKDDADLIAMGTVTEIRSGNEVVGYTTLKGNFPAPGKEDKFKQAMQGRQQLRDAGLKATSTSPSTPIGAPIAQAVAPETAQQGSSAIATAAQTGPIIDMPTFFKNDPENAKKFQKEMYARRDELKKQMVKESPNDSAGPGYRRIQRTAELQARQEMMKKYEKEASAAGAIGGGPPKVATVTEPDVGVPMVPDAIQPSATLKPEVTPIGAPIAQAVAPETAQATSRTVESSSMTFSMPAFREKDPENAKLFQRDFNQRRRELLDEKMKKDSGIIGYRHRATAEADIEARIETIKKYEKQARDAGALTGDIDALSDVAPTRSMPEVSATTPDNSLASAGQIAMAPTTSPVSPVARTGIGDYIDDTSRELAQAKEGSIEMPPIINNVVNNNGGGGGSSGLGEFPSPMPRESSPYERYQHKNSAFMGIA